MTSKPQGMIESPRAAVVLEVMMRTWPVAQGQEWNRTTKIILEQQRDQDLIKDLTLSTQEVLNTIHQNKKRETLTVVPPCGHHQFYC